MRRKINSILIIMILTILCLCQNIYTRVFGGVMALAADEEEDQEVAEIKGYTITYDEPDGNNGYYTKAPEIWVNHQDEGLVTKYRLTNPAGEVSEGQVNMELASVCLKPEQKDGTYCMEIWLETVQEEEGEAEGGEPGESGESKPRYSEEELKQWNKIFTWEVDATPPVIEVLSPKEGQWYNRPVEVRARAVDVGSGVEKSGGGSRSASAGEEGEKELHFTVTDASVNNQAVEIRLWARDKAGNISQVHLPVFIDMTPPVLTIEGAGDYEISSRDLAMSLKVQEENTCRNVKAMVEWEDVRGEKQERALIDETGKADWAAVEEVAQEGIYKFTLTASDKAGNLSGISKQVIVDKTSPVIKEIGGLQGKWLQEFCLDSNASDYVEDFTTYSYQMELDGRLYIPGQRVTREGRHILKLTAKDAAGNEAVEQAVFMIDHTPPVVLWEEKETGKEITGGSRFEKAVDILIRTRQGDDTITAVKINGESQNIPAGSSEFECTLEEVRMHEVEVTAQDRAGNRTQNVLDIQVEQAVSPVRKIFGGRKYKANKTGEVKKETGQENRFGAYAVMLLAAGLGITAGVWRIAKKRQINK